MSANTKNVSKPLIFYGILWQLYGDFERYFNDDLEFRLSMHAVINIEHFFTYWSLSKMKRTSQPVKVHLLN